MEIGEVIRKYRKEKQMTQEEMATRLGVTAPAVNKWEKGNSFPDVALLSPIARVLGITTDELLSFRDNLSQQEIDDIVLELGRRIKSEDYNDVFEWAKRQALVYPNCEALLVWMALLLENKKRELDIENGSYDELIIAWYKRGLVSLDEKIKLQAAASLFHLFLQKEKYEEAERYLIYFSDQNPEKKRKRALLCREQNQMEEAYRLQEELLFADVNSINLVLHDIHLLALKENKEEKIKKIKEKREAVARIFEMGTYQEVSIGLELAAMNKDKEETLRIMKEMLRNVESIGDFVKSDLFEHMKFSEISKENIQETRKTLLECFSDQETFGFLEGDESWKEA